MSIFVMKTEGGAPINESAFCTKHAGDPAVTDTAYDAGINAEDFHSDQYFEVTDEFAQANDTVCIGCNWDRLIESDTAE